MHAPQQFEGIARTALSADVVTATPTLSYSLIPPSNTIAVARQESKQRGRRHENRISLLWFLRGWRRFCSAQWAVRGRWHLTTRHQITLTPLHSRGSPAAYGGVL
jgi:hypothetical protein